MSKDDGSSEINLDSPGSCTPMDFSPYQETISVDEQPRDMPGESSPLVNSSAPWTVNSTVCTNENDVLLTGRKVTDAHDGIWKYSEPSEEVLGITEMGFLFTVLKVLNQEMKESALVSKPSNAAAVVLLVGFLQNLQLVST